MMTLMRLRISLYKRITGDLVHRRMAVTAGTAASCRPSEEGNFIPLVVLSESTSLRSYQTVQRFRALVIV